MKGLSRTNLMYMRAFAEAYPDEQIVLRSVGQIPWGHTQTLLDKLKTEETRLWYAHKTLENGWSRSILELQMAQYEQEVSGWSRPYRLNS